MHRIDADDAAGQFKKTPGPATIVTPEWANDVQGNLCEAIEGAGIALVKGDFGQLKQAIQGELGSGVTGRWIKWPSGIVEQYGVYAGGSAHPTITFPIEFPTACDNVQITAVSTSNSTPSGGPGGVHKADLDGVPGVATFTAWCSTDDGGPDTNQPSTAVAFHWRAIGR